VTSAFAMHSGGMDEALEVALASSDPETVSTAAATLAVDETLLRSVQAASEEEALSAQVMIPRWFVAVASGSCDDPWLSGVGVDAAT
jgi:hypothetical protein